MGCVPVIMTPFDLRILGGVALWLVLGALLFSGLKPPITGEQRYGNLSCLFCKFNDYTLINIIMCATKF